MNFTQDRPPKTSKPRGRPPFEATADKRAKVVELARLGVPQDQIAHALRISAKTLRKHFRDEIYDSAIEANRQILTKLFDLAISGNPGAVTFWARTRCKFRNGGSPFDEETAPPDPTGLPSPPITVEFSNNDGAPRGDW
jgi:hypothetical protein